METKPKTSKKKTSTKKKTSKNKVEKVQEPRFLWMLDPGHGGMIDGQYQTSGKRSPVWEDGTQYFEGVGNRQIVSKLLAKCKEAGIKAVDIVDSEKDVPLRTRINRANEKYTEEGKKAIYVSIHSDAFSKESAHGYSVYTSKGQTQSDKVADVFINCMKSVFPDEKLRTDTTDLDWDKEADFYVLKNTYSPAILTENFFMTNERECKEILMTEEGQDKIVEAHFQAILEIENKGIV
jgi:N-acetylmuramoyl-L-alanine amidase